MSDWFDKLIGKTKEQDKSKQTIAHREKELKRDLGFRDNESRYNVITYSPGLVFAERTKNYFVPGDTVYVDEVSTNYPVYMKLGVKDNPWVPVRPGYTYRRKFRSITLTHFQQVTSSIDERLLVSNQVILYVTYGDFVRESVQRYGLGQVVCQSGVATTTPQDVLAPLTSLSGENTILGARGGRLIVKNTEAVGGQILYIGTGGPISNLFPIAPQERLEIDLIGRTTYLVRTAAATAAYAFMVYPWQSFQQDFSVSG